jgi:hypothetical protein
LARSFGNARRIFGVAQAQSHDQTLTFTSQTGLARIDELAQIDF